jgi:alkylation response protein AidB-like acyl-CoA dehydrogenase
VSAIGESETRDGAFIPTNGDALAEFTGRALAFLEQHAPRRSAERSGDGPDFLDRPVSLFSSRATEIDTIQRAKGWRATKYDAGFGWLSGPVEYGGGGLPALFEDTYDRLEALFNCPEDDPFAPGLEFVGPAILQYGTDRVRLNLLPAIYRGEIICCQLFSEPNAGSDLAAIRTRATRTNGQWVINGHKVWTSRAHVADFGLLLARTGTVESRHRGITAFVLDIHAPGVTVRPLRQMNGEEPFNEIFLDDVSISDSFRLGPIGQGWEVAMSTLTRERSAISQSERYRPGGLAEIAGPDRMRALASLAGRTSDPVIRQELADCYIRHMTTKWAISRLKSGPGSHPSAAAAAGIGKLLVARQLTASANLVARLIGPRMTAQTGTKWSDNWLPFVLGAPGPHIGGGTDEVVLNSIAERALGLPREPRPAATEEMLA